LQFRLLAVVDVAVIAVVDVAVIVDVVLRDRGRPDEASVLNAELKKASAYTTGDEKNVTAWLDLRNSAAHGHYTLYTSERVELLIASVRHFVTVFPA